jgi:hypothetical protein
MSKSSTMSLKDVRVAPESNLLARGMYARLLRTIFIIILGFVAFHFFASFQHPLESWFPQSREEVTVKKSFEWENVPQTNASCRI